MAQHSSAAPHPSALYWAVGVVGRLVARLGWRRNWLGAQQLPRGAYVLVSNHLANVDPIMLGDFCISHGIYPCFLAKDSLFKSRPLAWAFGKLGVIPVVRGGAGSSAALGPAVAALRAGQVVAIYPEGTFTDDPQLWPMRGKTGAVRLALEAGVPIVPIAQWGPQRVLAPGKIFPTLIPRQTSHILVGEPIDVVKKLESRPATAQLVREVTDEVMATIRSQVALLRELEADPLS